MAYTGTATNNTIWNTWNDSGTTSTATSLTNYVWGTWVTQTTTSTCTNATWTYWVNEYGRYVATTPYQDTRTPEQRVANAEAARVRAEEGRARAEESLKKQQAATKRALELLREHLSQQQRKQMAKHNYFLVKGGKSGKMYRVHTAKGIAGNIEELAANDNQKAIARYCVHIPYGKTPDPDNFLAQKLMLEYAEEELIKTANRTQIAA